MKSSSIQSEERKSILFWAFGAFLSSGGLLFAQSNVPKSIEGLTVPSFRDVISLSEPESLSISPDGKAIAYTVRSTDWERNRFDLEVWVARFGEEPFQLTRTKTGSSSAQQWSPDGRHIAFLADRGDETQIQIIRADGGEAFQLTKVEGGVRYLQWSPCGKQIAYSAVEPVSEERTAREKAYGQFAVEDQEARWEHLWLIDVFGTEPGSKKLTEGRRFAVGRFEFSPDGTRLAFDHHPNLDVNSRLFGRDISIVDVESGEITTLVDVRGSQHSPHWSPDGNSILFTTTPDNLEATFYLNSELAIVPATGGTTRVITKAFDEHPMDAKWTTSGIYFLGVQKTKQLLHHLDHDSGKVTVVNNSLERITGFDFADDGRTAALVAASSSMLPEVHRQNGDADVAKITSVTDQVKGWALGQTEVIEWKSLDGVAIEGVLYKPDGYRPGDRRPLMVIIHGGPDGTSMPRLVNIHMYPVAQWLAKGALVLMPNYRGSGGYGETFRSLNVRNLGVGDMWDVMSGVEHLVEQGLADPERMAAMGWSQGGYISAFLATNTSRFRALSVGAGISNWTTYYVNTDIHPFTRQYLQATPWDDPNIYAKTSPMTNVKHASTPTLIQHCENDRRVPIPNAFELFQGLRDNDVEAKLIVYQGFGHSITKPRELFAATWHNWQWFSKHIWDEEVVIPIKTPTEETSRDNVRSQDNLSRY